MASHDELSERQRYWLEHLEACERSGQTTKAYAQAHGLSVSMMYSWRKKLVRGGILVRSLGTSAGKGFARVQVVGRESAASEWRIGLPNGVQIGFSGAVDEALLTTVLGVVSRL